MQYVGRAIGSVSKTWSSINPATLSGAIDVIVVEHEDGTLSCSPFHVRFGKFQLLRPSQKKVEFIVNGAKTDLPMKLGDGGEAFFVFETGPDVDIPNSMMTSPVLSAASSPSSSPGGSPSRISTGNSLQEPEFLDLGRPASEPIPISKNNNSNNNRRDEENFSPTPIHNLQQSPTFLSPLGDHLSSSPKSRELAIERAKQLSKRLSIKNIPSKIDINGDIVLDMDGYKSNPKNIHDTDELIKQLLKDEFGNDYDISNLLKEDDQGNIRINSSDDLIVSDADSFNSFPLLSPSPIPSTSDSHSQFVSSPLTNDMISLNSADLNSTEENTSSSYSTNYFKTLRLTSEQLSCLNLNYGENQISFAVDKGKATISSRLFLWKSNVPIVISDIDGTITKSDALGHVLNLIGRDWTHIGVAKLFTDIELNGYNIMYLTARSVGQADSTRAYLTNINQDGIKLPAGPVILSPDRTIAAFRREVILKKPEVFKMACLNDIKSLYDDVNSSNTDLKTPFFAGFGNRITDALSYRFVQIPSSRIFTINPNSEVHMELLELAGYKSSYLHIGELVDHFFPPVRASTLNGLVTNDERYNDVTFWRDPLPSISDLSEEELVDGDHASNKIHDSHFKLKGNDPKGGLTDEEYKLLTADSMVSNTSTFDDEHENEGTKGSLDENYIHDEYSDDEEDEDYEDDEDEEDEEYDDEQEDEEEEEEEEDLNDAQKAENNDNNIIENYSTEEFKTESVSGDQDEADVDKEDLDIDASEDLYEDVDDMGLHDGELDELDYSDGLPIDEFTTALKGSPERGSQDTSENSVNEMSSGLSDMNINDLVHNNDEYNLPYNKYPTSSSPVSQPVGKRKSVTSLNSATIQGENYNSFVKASDLMEKLNLKDASKRNNSNETDAKE